MAKTCLKQKVELKLNRSKHEVFLRSDFKSLGGYSQIGRVLRQLIGEGKLIKISHGLYAKARLNRITGKPMPASLGGFTAVAQEALDRLGVQWQPSKATLAYNAGSTQVPVNTIVAMKKRINRKIAFDNFKLLIEED